MYTSKDHTTCRNNVSVSFTCVVWDSNRRRHTRVQSDCLYHKILQRNTTVPMLSSPHYPNPFPCVHYLRYETHLPSTLPRISYSTPALLPTRAGLVRRALDTSGFRVMYLLRVGGVTFCYVETDWFLSLTRIKSNTSEVHKRLVPWRSCARAAKEPRRRKR